MTDLPKIKELTLEEHLKLEYESYSNLKMGSTGSLKDFAMGYLNCIETILDLYFEGVKTK